MATGSVFNNLMGSSKGNEPEVGMGATVLMWTDRHSATIVDVKPGVIIVCEDEMRRKDGRGMSDAQEWEVAEEAVGPEKCFTLRKNGAWVQKGQGMKQGTRLLVGVRRHYYDFSF